MEELLLEKVKEKWLVKRILNDKNHLENIDIENYIYAVFPRGQRRWSKQPKFKRRDLQKVIRFYNKTKGYKPYNRKYIGVSGTKDRLKEKYTNILTIVGINFEYNWWNPSLQFIRLTDDIQFF
jgi:hypothetical protein